MQRVTHARVRVDSRVVGEIGPGLCCFVGVTHTDCQDVVNKMASKLWQLRVFSDNEGRMNRSLADVSGEVLIVSQFTLYGDTRKGRRPSFRMAAPFDEASNIIDNLITELKCLGAVVAVGSFGADMKVELTNDGPVTLMLEI